MNGEITAMADDTLHPAVLRMLGGLQPGKVLDVPAGQGALSLELMNMGFSEITCLDICEDNFKLTGVDFRKHDANTPLPYADNSFDYVVSVEGIEHFESPWRFIKEICRVLKPGGTMLISTPNTLSVNARLKYLISGYFPRFKTLMKEPERLFNTGADDAHICPIYYWQLYYFLTTSDMQLLEVSANQLVRRRNAIGRLVESVLAWVIRRNVRQRKFPDCGITSDAMMFGDCLILKLRKNP